MELIISECPLCSGKEVWTGITELRDGQTYFEMKCADCGSTGFEWNIEWEKLKGNEKIIQ